MPFKCEELKEGDVLVGTGHDEDCFEKGKHYTVCITPWDNNKLGVVCECNVMLDWGQYEEKYWNKKLVRATGPW